MINCCQNVRKIFQTWFDMSQGFILTQIYVKYINELKNVLQHETMKNASCLNYTGDPNGSTMSYLSCVIAGKHKWGWYFWGYHVWTSLVWYCLCGINFVWWSLVILGNNSLNKSDLIVQNFQILNLTKKVTYCIPLKLELKAWF